ncbi:hypothetical protein FHETE_5886 [Fusarium heterosporum]|uniref:Uncharacterized protein n=1 Tax=Fusarium heterosporum TaxID=42747 RepID=A0A8H5TCQ1_FUSHE|nr:hypothetical protein FHETE_5886 [Fusarium heterosporum]
MTEFMSIPYPQYSEETEIAPDSVSERQTLEGEPANTSNALMTLLSKKDKKKLKKLKEREMAMAKWANFATIKTNGTADNDGLGISVIEAGPVTAEMGSTEGVSVDGVSFEEAHADRVSTNGIPAEESSAGHKEISPEGNDKKGSFVLEYETNTSVATEVVQSALTKPESSPKPLCLPFSAQHRLMVYFQHSLEAMCFAFGQRHMPEILQEQGWDCPEAVELQVWTKELRFADCFRDRGLEGAKRIILLSSVAKIRDYAVSRTRLDSEELEKILTAAREMVAIVGEEQDISTTEKLCEDVVDTNRWLEEEKDQLTNKLGTKLGMLAAARAKVDALEETTRAAFDRGLQKRQSAAHTKVLIAIEKAEADKLADVPDRSVAPSSLDWVNGLEASLMLGEESQTESLV